MFDTDTRRVARWFFGGLAAMGAATFTHPIDLIKVVLQTPAADGSSKKPAIIKTTVQIVREQGFFALYNGLTASWLRQATYSTTRFAIYETVKEILAGDSAGNAIPFYQKVLLAGVSGAAGGFVGTPGDMINVRMQNDVKLPLGERRNYKHALDGVIKVARTEGVTSLFNGATTATYRAILMTIGQLCMYDQFKYFLLKYLDNMFEDDLTTHFAASLLAGAAATTFTQPLDVMKTRMMNAATGVYTSVGDCASDIYKTSGLFGFYKGYIPAFVRLAPHTILMFVFFEQLRLRFGYLKS